MAQNELVKKLLEKEGYKVRILMVSTQGDRDRKSSVTALGGNGPFVRDVEKALLSGEADIAVHCVKDLPYEMAPGLCIAGMPDAADPRDCLILREAGREPAEAEKNREAQEKYGVNFVRGRISEAASTFDNRVQIKAEDTLMGNPMTMNADLLVLMVGMCASEGTATLSKCAGIDGLYHFAQSLSPHIEDNLTAQPNLYLAGSCKRPMCIEDTIQDARAAAIALDN